jgi:hypothetical protein
MVELYWTIRQKKSWDTASTYECLDSSHILARFAAVKKWFHIHKRSKFQGKELSLPFSSANGATIDVYFFLSSHICKERRYSPFPECMHESKPETVS